MSFNEKIDLGKKIKKLIAIPIGDFDIEMGDYTGPVFLAEKVTNEKGELGFNMKYKGKGKITRWGSYFRKTDDTILNTIKFATSLPLNYVSFTLPYPIPGTGLYSKVKDRLKTKGKITLLPLDQNLAFHADFSECKLKFAIMKAAVQFKIKKYLREKGYQLIGKPFEQITDSLFKVIK